MKDASLRSNLIPEIVAIGQAVEAELIVEGIENNRQANSLTHWGVPYGQAYYFSHPLSASDFVAWLRQRHPSNQALDKFHSTQGPKLGPKPINRKVQAVRPLLGIS